MASDKPALRIDVTPGPRQIPAQQRIEQMPLRLADLLPARQPLRVVGDGDHAIVAARLTIGMVVAHRHQPVAYVMRGIGTETDIPLLTPGYAPEVITGRHHRLHRHGFRQEAEP